MKQMLSGGTEVGHTLLYYFIYYMVQDASRERLQKYNKKNIVIRWKWPH